MTRLCLACALLLAACGSSPGGRSMAEGEALPLTRIVFRQYYGNSQIFILENLAGRDLVELRSRRLKPGEPPVAYIEDDVMARALEEFERAGFFEHAGPRPRDPRAVGGRAELTIIDESRNMKCFVRRDGQGARASECYTYCVQTFLAVYNVAGQFQATSGQDSGFGVRRADYGGR